MGVWLRTDTLQIYKYDNIVYKDSNSFLICIPKSSKEDSISDGIRSLSLIPPSLTSNRLRSIEWNKVTVDRHLLVSDCLDYILYVLNLDPSTSCSIEEVTNKNRLKGVWKIGMNVKILMNFLLKSYSLLL